MNFLQPVLGAALGLAALPFLLHLFTRRRYTDVPFAATIFLLQTRRRSLTRFTLHHLLILLCRAGAIALLALAFMMPSVRGFRALWPGGRSRVALAIVLDNTYSTGLRRRGVSAFERMRAAAVRVIETAGPEDEILVVAACGAAWSRPLTTERQSGAELARAVERMRPEACAGDALGAVNRAAHELRSADTPDRRVLLLTDAQAYALKGRVEAAAADAPQVRMADFGDTRAARDNISVTAVTFPLYPLRGRASPVCFMLRGGRARSRPVVTLTIDGRSRGEQSVRIRRDKRGRAQGRGCFRPTFNDTGSHAGAVTVQGDALAADNAYRFTFTVYSELRAVLIATRDTLSDPGADAYYAYRAVRAAGAGAAVKLDVVAQSQLAGALSGGARVAVVPSQTALTWDAARRLREFADNGGGVLLFSDASATPGAVTDRMFFSGATVLTSPAGSGAGPAAQRAFETIGQFDAAHPALSDFTGGRADEVRATRFYRPAALTVNAPDIRVLMRLSDARPLLIERRLGRGRAALLASAANPYATDMPLKTWFIPFMARMLAHLSEPHGAGRRVFRAGEPVTLDYPDPVNAAELRARPTDHNGRGVVLAAARTTGGSRFAARTSPGPGLYDVFIPGRKTRIDQFAVNPDPAEGIPDKATAAAIKKKFRGYDFAIFDAARFFPAGDVTAWAFNKEHTFVWLPFAAAAFLLLIAEVAVANRK